MCELQLMEELHPEVDVEAKLGRIILADTYVASQAIIDEYMSYMEASYEEMSIHEYFRCFVWEVEEPWGVVSCRCHAKRVAYFQRKQWAKELLSNCSKLLYLLDIKGHGPEMPAPF